MYVIAVLLFVLRQILLKDLSLFQACGVVCSRLGWQLAVRRGEYCVTDRLKSDVESASSLNILYMFVCIGPYCLQ